MQNSVKSLLLFSGGLDSTVAAYDLRSRDQEVLALSILYGQRHRKEVESSEKIAAHLGMRHQIINLDPLQICFKGNSQTDPNFEVPEGHYAEESMKLTVVPNRNMIFLSVGIALALSENCESVAYAAHGGDHTIYPDCRPEFVEAMQKAAQLCDWKKVNLVAPFLQMTKADIVQRGLELDVPFQMTWSCYKGLEKHCGKCGTCVERREAFAEANVPDPTSYMN